MLPVLFEIGQFKVYSFGIMVVLAFGICYLLARREFAKYGIRDAKINQLFAIVAIAGFFGAKMLYLVENSPAEYLSIGQTLFFKSGFSWYGGFFCAGIFGIYYLSQLQLRLAVSLDILVPLVLLGYAVGRIGCQLAGDGDYGPPSEMPWAMAYPAGIIPVFEPVHPTPVYDTLISSLFFIPIWYRKKPMPIGRTTVLSLIALGCTRFVTEFFRNTPVIAWGWFRVAHGLSILLIILAFTYFWILQKEAH
ncbi:MAG: hypothetical protein DWQ05_02375 [Calditrichaeota bacterium]|nr:MAG: hypothetical protein DWQ05_02375 [Calditrichota bacterium]